MSFDTKQISSQYDDIAPDGSEVRVLCRVGRGSMAHFTLPPRAVSKAVASDNLEELWYFISGHGQMWRRLGSREEIVDVGPGLCINIPAGTHFQFRSTPMSRLWRLAPPCRPGQTRVTSMPFRQSGMPLYELLSAVCYGILTGVSVRTALRPPLC